MAGSGINKCTNPSFETNLNDWTFANCSFTRSTFVAPGTGSYSAQMVATGGAPMTAVHVMTNLVVGVRYNASFYSYIKTAANPYVLQAVSAPWKGINPSVGTLRWTRQWVAFTATATNMPLVIQATANSTAGDTAYIDRIKITDGEFMGPYFDGNYPYSFWSGTVNNSASVSAPFTSTLNTGTSHAEDPIVSNGLCLNTLAWNIESKSGRYNLPSVRGSNTSVPGQRGQTFVKNKPVDVGTWSVQLWILGCYSDGSVPPSGEMKRIFDVNYNQILQQVMSVSSPINLCVWQSDGSVRTASGTISSSVNAEVKMGGRRAEIALAFEILEGVWADYLPTVTTGVSGAHWSNDVLLMPNLAGGSAPIENAVVTVYGPITNPRVTDVTTGTWVQFNGTIASNAFWVVDSGKWLSTVNNVGQLANTQHFGHPRFLVIDSGQMDRVPQVTLSGTSTGANTNISVSAARQHWSA